MKKIRVLHFHYICINFILVFPNIISYIVDIHSYRRMQVMISSHFRTETHTHLCVYVWYKLYIGCQSIGLSPLNINMTSRSRHFLIYNVLVQNRCLLSVSYISTVRFHQSIFVCIKYVWAMHGGYFCWTLHRELNTIHLLRETQWNIYLCKCMFQYCRIYTATTHKIYSMVSPMYWWSINQESSR